MNFGFVLKIKKHPMETKLKQNCKLINQVILLHELGFDRDFIMHQEKCLISVQDNECYVLSEVTLTKAQIADNDIQQGKSLYKVETLCGVKGLMLATL